MGPLGRAITAPPLQALFMRSDLDARVGRSAIEGGDSPIADLRVLAERLHAELEPGDDPSKAIGAGRLYAATLLQSALLAVVARYAEVQRPGVLTEAVAAVAEQLSTEPTAVLAALGERFTFGALPSDPEGLLAGLLLLETERENPALAFMAPMLAEDPGDGGEAALLRSAVELWLVEQEPVGVLGEPLPVLLSAPAQAGETLDEQVAWVLEAWKELLPPRLLTMLLRARDLLEEEHRMRDWDGGPVEAPVLEFGGGYGGGDDEYEGFSHDADWMPNVILLAKQTHVWLDQLSKKYERTIDRIDLIPDEELDEIAQRGFTGLWLIGLWERSWASGEIKRRCGNPEAVASAYSLYDYSIAQGLGGDGAYQSLRDRASQRGLRLAADMVPNHFGVDSKWVVEHPERFLGLPHSPYPNYRFEGPDLCLDDRVGVYLEEGYWHKSDAAVCFKRVDHETGEVRYIYHGNDGTQMPWNDTAQLDYLNPEVREAVIQTILEVARRFPIIRFDAAMTLARRHIQRLWYPPPGSGGAIPSRSEYAVSPEDFAAAMPAEFWREVVDRVAKEVPDTLLLAEAFWLMEGYFVRTLGMHRVYNSAFMHMLRDEENSKYRQTIKNVLEYSPAILERFVNFMNNPDEETAAEQFGTFDKYFGIATLLVTVPGLPMFGHGQVEGFREKYGMEYRKAYWDEQPDEGLVGHHERVIFPLLRQRYLFSGVKHFAMYDFTTGEGWVDENVYALSNRSPDGNQRAVVLFNNAHEGTAGHFRHSVSINLGSADEPSLERPELWARLGLRPDADVWYAFRELGSDQHFLRNGKQIAEQGLWAQLAGYQCQVFLDWREIVDEDGSWAKLAEHLEGGGVPDLDAALAALIDPEDEDEDDEEIDEDEAAEGAIADPSIDQDDLVTVKMDRIDLEKLDADKADEQD
jgi:glycosidase